MNSRFHNVFRTALAVLCFAGLAAAGFGQATTSAILGRVLDNDNRPVGDAEVLVIHQPTGTRYETSTRSNGSFTLRGLRPGGPYEIRASALGYTISVQRSVFLDLDSDNNVSLVLQPEAIVELEEFLVTGSDFDRFFRSDRMGAGSMLGSDDIENAPVGDRSLNSLLRLDPRIIYNRDPSDRAFSAGGASNRYNSILIDGVSAADPFGLNSNNTAAERNVIPLDSIEAVTIATTPFDVRRGGFTGAQINAVTRSGGNEFRGSIYYIYRSDKMVRTNLERIDGSKVRVPEFKEKTMGFTLGGPIIRDTLFFFLSYEKVDEDRNPPSINNFPTAEALTRIRNAATTLGIDPGTAPDSVDLKLKDDNILAKIDWNINQNHRFSIRYNTVASERPTFPGYGNNNLSFDSHWYIQEIENTSYIAQLFSTWNQDFTTEISLAYSEYRSEPKWERALPQVVIRRVPLQGTNQTGNVTFGTERSRHFNRLEVDTWTFELFANYYINLNNTLTFGYQLERSDIFNAFVQDFLGNYDFWDISAFEAAATGGWRGRYLYTFENPGQNPAAEFNEANHAFFVQNTFRPNPRLSLMAGLRIDIPKFGEDVPYNALFDQTFGFANNATYSGNSVIQPRFGFNWQLDEEGLTQLRGGGGLFYGRMPRVWMSNSYSNTGFNFGLVDVNNNNNNNPNTPAFSPNPFGQGPFAPDARAQRVVAIDPDFKLPSSWKATIGLDRRVGNLVFSAEAEFAWVHRDILNTNLNRVVSTVAPDGREILGGRVSNAFENDIIYMTNTSKGNSHSFAFTVERPRQEDGWYWRASYIAGRVREVQYGTSSVARSNWANRSILNQGEDVVSRGELEISDRFLGILRKDFELVEGFRTRLSLIYDGRAGLPFSFTYSNDVNNDGVTGNDLIYVPFRDGDPRVVFADQTTRDLFFRMVDRYNLTEGEVAPAGAARYPWVHQFDFSISQEIALPGWRHRLEIGFDILNVGNLLNSSWGIIRGSNSFFVKTQRPVRAVFNSSTGQYTYSLPNEDLANGAFNPHGGRGEPSSSRWTGLLTLRYRF